MTIFADECVNKDITDALENKGVKIIRVSDVNFRSAPDEEIFRYALANNYVLLTFDKDFGNILRFNIGNSSGIVIVYIEDMHKEEIINNTLYLFSKFNQSQLKGKLFIVEKTRIRIWPK